MALVVFSPSVPVTVRGKSYENLIFSRPAGIRELQIFGRYRDPKVRACAVIAQLAGVPRQVVQALSDPDFVRLERETRHLFLVA